QRLAATFLGLPGRDSQPRAWRFFQRSICQALQSPSGTSSIFPELLTSRQISIANCRVIRFPVLADLPTTPFSGTDVVQGVEPSSFDGDCPGRVRVEVDGKPDILAFYGAAPKGAPADPL